MTTITDATGRTERAGHFREDALLTVEDLHCSFKTSSGTVNAVRGVSFDVLPGETLGLVGESGCGKTTTGRAVLQLPPGRSGSIRFDGRELAGLPRRELRSIRGDVQMIFQDPLSSFNPRRKVVDIVAEGLEVQGVPRSEIPGRVAEALGQVGLSTEMVGDRRPHEFSGGQCQRISIARASLDVSVQARVLNVLLDIRERNGLSLVFVSHDLAVVRVVSDRIAVMCRGRIVEIGDADLVYGNPAHPYTRKLLDAVPVMDEAERPYAGGWSPTPVDDTWRTKDHDLVEVEPGHYAALGPETTTGPVPAGRTRKGA